MAEQPRIPINVTVDSKKLDDLLIKSLLQTNLSERFEKTLNEAVEKALAPTGTSYTRESLLEKVLNQEINGIIRNVVMTEYSDRVREAVRQKLTDELVDEMINKMWSKLDKLT